MICRWFYWRVNGWGFCAGSIGGISAAVLLKWTIPEATEWGQFLAICIFSFLCLVSVTFLTSPTEDLTVDAFYRKTKPPGFWGPYRARIREEEEENEGLIEVGSLK